MNVNTKKTYHHIYEVHLMIIKNLDLYQDVEIMSKEYMLLHNRNMDHTSDNYCSYSSTE